MNLSLTLAVIALLFGVPLLNSVNAQSRSDRSKKAGEDAPPPVLTAPTPIYISSLFNCEKLRKTGGIWSFVTEDWELMLSDIPPPQGPSGPYPFLNGVHPNGVTRTLPAGTPESASRNVSIIRSGQSINWSSNLDITVVIMNTPSGDSYYYPYPNGSRGGIPDGVGLTTPPDGTGGFLPLTEVRFCFEDDSILIPSAAPVALTGRAISTGGRGIASVRILITNGTTGEVRGALSNSFGYYRVDDLVVGELYSVTATHKRYQFVDGQRTISLEDNLDGYDFVASN